MNLATVIYSLGKEQKWFYGVFPTISSYVLPTSFTQPLFWRWLPSRSPDMRPTWWSPPGCISATWFGAKARISKESFSNIAPPLSLVHAPSLCFISLPGWWTILEKIWGSELKNALDFFHLVITALQQTELGLSECWHLIFRFWIARRKADLSVFIY